MNEYLGFLGDPQETNTNYGAIYHLSQRFLRILFDHECELYSISYYLDKESLRDLIAKIDSLKNKKASLSEDGEWYEIIHDFDFCKRVNIAISAYEEKDGVVLTFLGNVAKKDTPFDIIELSFFQTDLFRQFEKDLRSLYEKWA
jgi:hypothetical protein